MYLVYKTDTCHSYASRDIIGICSDKSSVILICCEQAEKEGEPLGGEDLFELTNYAKTQNYNGEGEFQFEHVQEDVLL